MFGRAKPPTRRSIQARPPPSPANPIDRRNAQTLNSLVRRLAGDALCSPGRGCIGWGAAKFLEAASESSLTGVSDDLDAAARSKAAAGKRSSLACLLPACSIS